MRRYGEIRGSILRRIGEDFEDFFDRINEETRRQLGFTDAILRGYPIVVEEVGKMIKDGNYPVLEYRPPNQRNINYPAQGRRATIFENK